MNITEKTHQRIVADYDADRREAFKRIDELFVTARYRNKEKLKWCRTHPSPRKASEQLENIIRSW